VKNNQLAFMSYPNDEKTKRNTHKKRPNFQLRFKKDPYKGKGRYIRTRRKLRARLNPID
jgi:hypothetical protein